jgi:hypothetical protein
MRTFLTFSILFLSICSVRPQQRVKIITRDSIINKWTHAIISVQCIESIEKRADKIRQRLIKKEIDLPRANREGVYLDDHPYFSSGTAIFFENGSDTFLLSARHVFEDTGSFTQNSISSDIVLMRNIDSYKNKSRGIYIIDTPTTKSNPEAKITVLDSNIKINSIYLNRGDDDEGTSLNSVNTPNKEPGRLKYYFSSISDDLALINLTNANYEGEAFITTLRHMGYNPINIRDIDTFFKVKYLDSIVSFGFPKESLTKTKDFSGFHERFESSTESAPMVSSGNISRINPGKNYFEANMFTYHGFSGGPIVKNNKLIGMVNAFWKPKIETNSIHLRYFLSYKPKYVKSSVIYKFIQDYYKEQASQKLQKQTSVGSYREISPKIGIRAFFPNDQYITKSDFDSIRFDYKADTLYLQQKNCYALPYKLVVKDSTGKFIDIPVGINILTLEDVRRYLLSINYSLSSPYKVFKRYNLKIELTNIGRGDAYGITGDLFMRQSNDNDWRKWPNEKPRPFDLNSGESVSTSFPIVFLSSVSFPDTLFIQIPVRYYREKSLQTVSLITDTLRTSYYGRIGVWEDDLYGPNGKMSK